MKTESSIIKRYSLSILVCVFWITVSAQSQYTQVVKGQVIDKDSKISLPGANVIILNQEPVLGATTDIDGYFRIDEVPVGRQTIQVSFLGYEPILLSEILVSTGKELVVNVELKESITNLESVTVQAYKKNEQLNKMATLSARTVTVEETQKFAGGLSDPGRLVTAYAGVASTNTSSNGIVIRGNSPKGVLWKIEGVDVPNPNHFAEGMILGGGIVCALSSQVISNSGFYTGAFPAEYGNALSGVFDINLRSGNSDNSEKTIEVGALGLDVAAEGPFKKGKKATYLFNYRYSTFGLINFMLPDDALPEYQNLTFNMNLPTKKAGKFKIWGFGGLEKLDEKHTSDSSEWEYEDDKQDYLLEGQFGAVGLSHNYIINKRHYLKNSLVASGRYLHNKESDMDSAGTMSKTFGVEKSTIYLGLNSFLNSKFSAKHTNKTGLAFNVRYYDIFGEMAHNEENRLEEFINDNGNGQSMQVYSQSRIQFTENSSLNIGTHLFYYGITDQTSVEPRVGYKQSIGKKNTVSIAYGLHSQAELIDFYLTKVHTDNITRQPNKNLKLSKAHHFVLGYECMVNDNIRFKAEPYIQLLFDIPVVKGGSFSMLNYEESDGFQENLVNSGTGENYGIDLTLERFLNKGYYYLISASVFESKYTGEDNVTRNTLNNRNIVANVLGGKEWNVGKNNKQNILSANARMSVCGGRRYTPINTELSLDLEEIVEDDTKIYAKQHPYSYRMDLTFSYRRNKKRYASVWSLQWLNVLFSPDEPEYMYNIKTQRIDKDSPVFSIPSISYKIEF